MIDQCADCAAELNHCHGTLIVHHDGVLECTEDGCFVLDSVRHDLIVGCAGDGDCDYGCAALVVSYRRSA